MNFSFIYEPCRITFHFHFSETQYLGIRTTTTTVPNQLSAKSFPLTSNEETY